MKSSAQKQKNPSKNKSENKTGKKQKQKVKNKQKQKYEQKNQQKNNNGEKYDQSKNLMAKLKKTKSGFAKIKSQIQHTVNAKNIIKLIRKGTKNIPNFLTKQQSKALLPKLQKLTFPENSKQQNQQLLRNKKKFEEIQGQLTQSMVLFKKNQEISKSDLWAIDMQTQKCYKMIPSYYFKQHKNTEEQQLVKNLNKYMVKNNKQINETILNLIDYQDQVQFNINQQANAKIKIFMNFVLCMNSIQDLVNINTQKLRKTRKHIGLLRDIIVSRAVRINQNRLKKQNIEQTLKILQIFKKLKLLENKLNIQISLGNFISHDSKSKLGALYNQYCQIHNQQLNRFCCKNNKNNKAGKASNICRYWDITYFVERGFQDNFMKMIKSYILQLIVYQKQVQTYKKCFIHNRKNFTSTPNNNSNAATQSSITNSGYNMLDQSYQVDAFEHVQLITKIHIQKEIVALLEQGMQKYSFSTQQLEQDIREYITSYLTNFLTEVLGVEQESQLKLTLKQISEQKLSNNTKNTNAIDAMIAFLQSEKCKQKILKTNWTQFDKIMELIITRFQYLSIRVLSLVQKLLLKTSQIQVLQPERSQVISTNFIQLVNSILTNTDLYLSIIIKHKNKRDSQKSITLFKSKDQIHKQVDVDHQNMKKLVKYCKKWLSHTQIVSKNYPLCRIQLKKIENKQNKQKGQKTVSVKVIKQSERSKKTNYRWSPKMQLLKLTIVKSNYQLFHKILTSRSLKQKLQDDTYQYIQIKTQFYNDLGYIIGGNQFLVEQEKTQRQSLPNSVLMQRSQSQIQRAQKSLAKLQSIQQGTNNSKGSNDQTGKKQYKKQQYSSRFKINPNYITLTTTNLKFKIISSTQFMIKSLRKLLQLFDDLLYTEAAQQGNDKDLQSNKQIKIDLHAKLTQIILMYNQFTKDLILKGEIIKQGKIKSKSVTAKILIVTFIQLEVIEIIFTGEIMEKRIGFTKQECITIREKIIATQQEIKKKYQKILQMRIIQTIDAINFKQKQNWLQSQLFLSIPKNFHTSFQVFDNLMLNEGQFKGFLDIDSSWTAQLLNKINKLSKAKDLKNKCFNFLVQEIEPYKQYMPRVFIAIKSVVN